MTDSFKEHAIAGLACALLAGFVPACNSTEGECYPRGQGGTPGAGAGGGVIVPGQGGFGDVPPDQQGSEGSPDPCNAVEGRLFYCSGVVNCVKPDEADVSDILVQCVYFNREQAAKAAGEALEIVIKECQSGHPGYSCSQNTLECGDKPKSTQAADIYVCNGGVLCTNAKGFMDGCTFIQEEVIADDEPEAIGLLVENCEVDMHDKYKHNCDHGGMCCQAGSLTCHKK